MARTNTRDPYGFEAWRDYETSDADERAVFSAMMGEIEKKSTWCDEAVKDYVKNNLFTEYVDQGLKKIGTAVVMTEYDPVTETIKRRPITADELYVQPEPIKPKRTSVTLPYRDLIFED